MAEKLATPKITAFLAAIRAYPNITEAAKAAGIDRRAHYQRLERDPAYKERFLSAYREGIEALEDAAIRRAQRGVRKLVVYHGAPVMVPKDPNDPEGPKVWLYEREYSDQLMSLLLKGKKPDVYSERVKQEISGEGGGPVKVEVVFVKPKPGDDQGNG